MAFMYVWNRVGEGGSALAEKLGLRRIKHENSRFIGSARKTVINWGSSTLPAEVMKCNIINRPELVKICADKREFFNTCDPETTVPFTTEVNKALEWLAARETVVARTVLSGHSAEGLVIVRPEEAGQLTRAPLYTMYVKKKDEYRVHIANGIIVDVQRKSLKKDFVEAAQAEGREINHMVRNLENGYIYQRENVNAPEDVKVKALTAVESIGLDFGAVDVIYNGHQERAYVLEINTAPGLTGTTLDNYANALRNLI